MGRELVRKVQRVDHRAAGTVEEPGPEADHFLVVLRREVHYDPPWAQVIDGKPERGTADAVDDDIELTAEMLGDRRGGIADQRGDISAARLGELDRHPPDSARGTSDQYALAKLQASDRKRP